MGNIIFEETKTIMKLDFNFTLLDFAGEAIKDEKGSEVSAGKLLSRSLGNLPSKEINDAIKSFTWGKGLHDGEVIDLDESDQAKLKAFIKNEAQFSPIVEAQLLRVFNKEAKTVKK